MNEKQQKELQRIPQVDKILSDTSLSVLIEVLGRQTVKEAAVQYINSVKQSILNGKTAPDFNEIISVICQMLHEKSFMPLQKVINGTGIVLHTNLGRAPLSMGLLEDLKKEMSGYFNIEYDLSIQKRGKRGAFVNELICQLTGAEEALVVNNNASAVFLILSALAKDKEVIISRGELVQIGGGFRIPDILRNTGVLLKEVGTTNITTLDDYREALSSETSLILKVHQSNFRQEGFTSRPDISQLRSLKSNQVFLVEDLGSGNLLPSYNGFEIPEPSVGDVLSKGADLVCFSGDKLLGSCQAGIIAGNKELVKRLSKHPLMRIIRVDKVIYYLLQKTLLHYLNKEYDNILSLSLLQLTPDQIEMKIHEVLKPFPRSDILAHLKIADTHGRAGGGSLPEMDFPGRGLLFSSFKMTAGEMFDFFAKQQPAIIGIVHDDQFLLDFRCILPHEYVIVQKVLSGFFMKHNPNPHPFKP